VAPCSIRAETACPRCSGVVLRRLSARTVLSDRAQAELFYHTHRGAASSVSRPAGGRHLLSLILPAGRSGVCSLPYNASMSTACSVYPRTGATRRLDDHPARASSAFWLPQLGVA